MIPAVEEAAAAAESLQEQAQSLTQAVSVFKVAHTESRAAVQAAPAPRTATVTAIKRCKPAEVRQPVKPGPMTQPKKVANAKSGDAEWQEF